MDQGNDAVHVREILERGQILLKGPETGIKGFYHGPLWYYFIAPGYLITGGHPFGAVFILILLNLGITAILMYKIKKYVGPPTALLIGASLQFFWWFYDASRYGFNPFPLATLSILLILFLIDFLEDKRRKILSQTFNSYTLAIVPVGLAFHSETAAAIPFTIFYFLVGIVSVFKKKLAVTTFLASLLVFPIFFIPRIISEIQTNFYQTRVLRRELAEPYGVFSHAQYEYVSAKFKNIITQRITPQSTTLSSVVLTVVLLIFIKTAPKNNFVKYFVFLSLSLVLVSWIWFSTNRGWQVWHTIYIRPLLFISILLMLSNITRVSLQPIKRLAFLLLLVILVSQLLFFKDRYLLFATASSDPSLLANELAAVDWIYQKSQNQGFYVYSYLPSVEDYLYQYLFWWCGTKKYGYGPCEYSTFPKVPDLFVPGVKYYQKPQKPCGNLRFLIIEPDQNQNNRDLWTRQVTKDTLLLEEASFGKIKVEKRQQ